MTHQTSKRWRLPNTEIDIVRIDDGPRAGEYLVSAGTIERLPEFYERVKDLPYKPGPGQQLAEVYRSISHGGSATIYDAFLGSPAGLSYIVPTRWMLNLPGWATVRVAGVATWQWLGLGLGFLVGGLIIFGGHRLARARSDGEGQDAPAAGWRALPVPLAIVLVTGVLVPLFGTLLRIGGSPRVAIAYATTGAVILGAAWLAVVASVVVGDAIVASERLTIQSLDSQLIRLGTRLIGLVAAVAILIKGGDELGISGLLDSRRPRRGRPRRRTGGTEHDRQPDRLAAHCDREAVPRRPRRQDQWERGDRRGRRLPQHPHPHAGQLAGDDPEQRRREHDGGEPQRAYQAASTLLRAGHLRYVTRQGGSAGCRHQAAHRRSSAGRREHLPGALQQLLREQSRHPGDLQSRGGRLHLGAARA